MNDERIEKIVRPHIEEWTNLADSDQGTGAQRFAIRSCADVLEDLIPALSEVVRQAHAEAIVGDDQIKHMVNRFLQWRLPENFNPDGGISFKKTYNEHAPWGPMKNEPVGTNLLDATQAEEMVRYITAELLSVNPGDRGVRLTEDYQKCGTGRLYSQEEVDERVRQAHAEAIEAADGKCEEVLQSRDPDDVKGIAAANLCGLAIQSITPAVARIEAELRTAEAVLVEASAWNGELDGHALDFWCCRVLGNRMKAAKERVATLRRERDAEIERQHGKR